MEVEFRRLTATDVAKVHEIEKAVFPAEAWSEHLIREELTSRWGHYIGAFMGERLIGYGGIKGSHEGDLMTLAVSTDYRRLGLGRQIVELLLERARAVGIGELFLEVRVSNDPARALYQALGFAPVGLIANYYRDPVEDAVAMRIEL